MPTAKQILLAPPGIGPMAVHHNSNRIAGERGQELFGDRGLANARITRKQHDAIPPAKSLANLFEKVTPVNLEFFIFNNNRRIDVSNIAFALANKTQPQTKGIIRIVGEKVPCYCFVLKQHKRGLKGGCKKPLDLNSKATGMVFDRHLGHRIPNAVGSCAPWPKILITEENEARQLWIAFMDFIHSID